ncbi:MAG TPA: dTMP kinase [Candidatus Acidoferrum sp.]|nr:dTMP kinase [Candidatus Acidoferrum sp.]
MKGLLITFEGTEGGGKSTQIQRLATRLQSSGRVMRLLREPGGTPIGEEIRHTLKHSASNHAMTPETELLLMNASRAQLVREIIRPALANDEIVLCDRFHDSTVVYQGYGRQLDLTLVRSVIDIAVGETRPHLTLLLRVPLEVSEARRTARGSTQRDRFEEADREFFRRVELGYDVIATADPQRIHVIDATRSVDEVAEDIWRAVEPLVR